MKIDRFVIAIIISIILAYFFPQLGRSDSPIPLDTVSSIGISLIFMFYGLKLSTEELAYGLRNWKFHLLAQGSTFILFPLIVLATYPFVTGQKHETIWLAFLFLAALPSTVTSSVVMVSLARGNVPAAIFNASISGIIGIAITPLWMAPFLSEQHTSVDTGEIYLSLLTEILLPLVIGLSLRRWLGHFARRHSKQFSIFDKSIILLVIYKSFAHSFEEQVFSSIAWSDIMVIMVLVLLLFFAIYGITGLIARYLHFNTADRIAVQFCGSKKSLIHGTVFSKALFRQSSAIGLILLPLMMFHALQILIVSIIATELGKRNS